MPKGKHKSEQERREILAEWAKLEKQGVTAIEAAKIFGVSANSLRGWRRKYGKQPEVEFIDAGTGANKRGRKKSEPGANPKFVVVIADAKTLLLLAEVIK